ncbi:MAG: hypothetical protein J0I18_20925 [Actinobacteria bacterium]|nr:hypothetical protein [Actinomycetota bacterium]
MKKTKKAAVDSSLDNGSRPRVEPDFPLVLGGMPRVSLIPPEVLDGRKARGVRRALVWGVLGVLVITVVAIGGTALLGLKAQAGLADAQAQTGELLAEQGRYVDVKKTQNDVDLAQAAQRVGASTEIDWKDYLDKVQATLPADAALKSVAVNSATPLATYEQPTAPLQGSRVATLVFQATSPVLPVVPTWLASLATLPGFADATPDSVTLDDTTHLYTVTITMHINDAAYDKRFQLKEK